MPEQKTILSQRLRNIPFTGPQYDYVKHLLGTLDRVVSKIELLELREQIYLSVIAELSLFHHKDSRAYLPTPSGKVRSGVTYHASDVQFGRITQFNKDELKEIINSRRR